MLIITAYAFTQDVSHNFKCHDEFSRYKTYRRDHRPDPVEIDEPKQDHLAASLNEVGRVEERR